MGFRWPGGWFGWWLFGLTAWTTISGLAGVLLQKWVPLMITGKLSVEAIYERIPELAESLRTEASKIAAAGPRCCSGFTRRKLQPALAGLSPSWSYLLDAHRGREAASGAVREDPRLHPEADRGKLADLQTLVSEKCELEAHYSLQRVLRSWQVLHVAAGGAAARGDHRPRCGGLVLLMARQIVPGTPSRSSKYMIRPIAAGCAAVLAAAGAVLILSAVLYLGGVHRVASRVRSLPHTPPSKRSARSVTSNQEAPPICGASAATIRSTRGA